MTQPTTAPRTAAVPRQRTAEAEPAVREFEPVEPQPTGWAAFRRNLAIVRGLRSMGSVPARPQAEYGETDGH